jgi:large subunit ribosomal protein L4
MERSVLKELIKQHESDLVSKVVINGFAPGGPQSGIKVLGA